MDLYGFIYIDGSVSLMTINSMIDYETGKIATSVVSTLSTFIEKSKSLNFTILENVPIAKDKHVIQ